MIRRAVEKVAPQCGDSRLQALVARLKLCPNTRRLQLEFIGRLVNVGPGATSSTEFTQAECADDFVESGYSGVLKGHPVMATAQR